MARDKNFLLGSGERLTAPVTIETAPGDKTPPYDFPKARDRIVAKLGAVNRVLRALPSDSCPGDRAVALVTMHPRYIAKSDYPEALLKAAGLEPIGSRSREVEPDAWGIKKHSRSAVTEEIFVEGTRAAFAELGHAMSKWKATGKASVDLTHIEDVTPFTAKQKLRALPLADGKTAVLEVVLHNAGDSFVVNAFEAFARRLGAKVDLGRRRDVRGLTFIPVELGTQEAESLASFSFVRVVRGMPVLRPLRPSIAGDAGTFPVKLPDEDALDERCGVLVFDGGIPGTVDLSKWVTQIDAPGVGAPHPEYQEHGLAVTTSLLFGPLAISRKAVPPQPLCRVHHVRVLDDGNASRPEFLYPDVLKRIMAYLHETKGRYKFVNISLGPDLAVDDDDVTAWTASLDEFFAENPAVVTVAAGNEGEGNRASGDHRVQPPADAVNLLSVGACDSQGSTWKAASYSSRGPGRSPGVVKPDGVVFGGRPEEPFIVLASAKTPHGRGVFGTSYAAPYALRGAVGCGIQLGDSVSPLGIRALLIHRAEAGGHDRVDVGWGRFDTDPGRLITCEDSEAIVMYQGKLPLGQHLRAQLPVPPGIKGRLSISATLVVAPEVDPEHPGAYTRAGFEIVFRPSVRTLRQYQDGTVSKQPKSKRMFGERVYHAEYELRRDAHKWEPCRREATSVQAEKLDRPMFDVYYHHRLAGAAAAKPRPISYALVVGLRAPKVADLYRRVVLEFQNILVPIQPKVEIPISARVSR